MEIDSSNHRLIFAKPFIRGQKVFYSGVINSHNFAVDIQTRIGKTLIAKIGWISFQHEANLLQSSGLILLNRSIYSNRITLIDIPDNYPDKVFSININFNNWFRESGTIRVWERFS